MSNQNMNPKEIENRYLYNVTKRLPEKQRKDIEDELRTLIEDMLDERANNGKNDKDNMIEVLEELGDPAKLADKYRNQEDHLIGGEYYSNYCLVLKIALLCVGLSLVLSFVINMFISAISQNDMDQFARSMTNSFMNLAAIPTTLVSLFGWITLIFVFLERKQVKLQRIDDEWKVEKLPLIPDEKAVIKRSDSIINIVFTLLFMIWLLFAPEFFGLWLKDESGKMIAISIFNMSAWSSIFVVLLISFLAELVADITKLIAGCYTYSVMWVNLICNTVSMAMTIWFFKATDWFNPNFTNQIQEITGKTLNGKYDILAQWITTQISNLILTVILFFTLLDIGITVYHTIRYAEKKLDSRLEGSV